MTAATCRRGLIERDPYLALDSGKEIPDRGVWQSRWVECKSAGRPPFVTAYRRRFQLQASAAARIHVSADERYELFLNGRRIGRGSEYGSADNWFYIRFFGFLIEFNGAVKVSMISQGERIHLKFCSPRHQFVNFSKSVKQAVMTMHV